MDITGTKKRNKNGPHGHWKFSSNINDGGVDTQLL
jgi:hypothetical protein